MAKRKTGKNPHIKKLLNKYNIPFERVTNDLGIRVWFSRGKEYSSLSNLFVDQAVKGIIKHDKDS